MYQRIRDLREDKDLKQSEVAEKLYLQREVYRRYETGQREIPLIQAYSAQKESKKSVDYFLSIESRLK